MIEQQEPIETQLLETLNADEPDYSGLRPLVTGEIIDTYLTPIVAYNPNHIGSVALAFAASSGLPEALHTIEAASEHVDTGVMHDWQVRATKLTMQLPAYGRTDASSAQISRWVAEDFDQMRNYAAVSAGTWYEAALNRGTEITAEAREVLKRAYDKLPENDAWAAEHVQRHYPAYYEMVAGSAEI